MFNSKLLNKGFRDLDSEQVIAALKDQKISDLETAKKFIAALRQSSCLVIEISDSQSEQRRDNLIIKCRELITACGVPSILEEFENHVEDAQIAELGFRAIFQNLYARYASHQVPQHFGCV